MRKYGLPLLLLVVVAVLVLPMTGCPKKTVSEAPVKPDEGKAPPTAPDTPSAAAGEVKWMDKPTVADVPAGAVKGTVNGEPFEALTTRVEKGDGKSTLELLSKKADTPTGMVMDATEVKLDFTIAPGKTGEFVKALKDKDPANTDGWFSYEQKDGSPMTMNNDWAVALQIESWTLAKDPSDPKALGKVKGKVYLVFDDDKKSVVAGEFEGPYYE